MYCFWGTCYGGCIGLHAAFLFANPVDEFAYICDLLVCLRKDSKRRIIMCMLNPFTNNFRSKTRSHLFSSLYDDGFKIGKVMENLFSGGMFMG